MVLIIIVIKKDTICVCFAGHIDYGAPKETPSALKGRSDEQTDEAAGKINIIFSEAWEKVNSAPLDTGLPSFVENENLPFTDPGYPPTDADADVSSPL